jgi:Ca2+-transporting ATPase
LDGTVVLTNNNADWHNRDVEEILSSLSTRASGLSPQEASDRLSRYGFNTVTSETRFAILNQFINQFRNLLTVILLAAGIISILVGAISDGIIIFAIVILNVSIGFFQEYKAERAVSALRKLVSKTTVVLRDGVPQEIAVEHVVPGDVLLLQEGMRIPADARVISCANLSTDESLLTGESYTKPKHQEKITTDVSISEMDNTVFMGTVVVSGNGKAVVFATGVHSEFGKISYMTAARAEELSPLQKELNLMAKRVAVFVFVLSIFVFAVGILTNESFYNMFMYSISIAVATVPEGLPATVTIALAIGVQQLISRRALVKQLSSIETLGCTQVICTDKTGTLTQNQMTVRGLFANDRAIRVTGEGYSPRGAILADISSADLQLINIGLLCNNATQDKKGEFIGDPSDIALYVLAEKANVNIPLVRNAHRRVLEKPFDAARKMMTVVCDSPDGLVSFTKGAPAAVLANCSHIVKGSDKTRLTEDIQRDLLKVNAEMAEEPLRVLALAYKNLHCAESEIRVDSLESDMTFVGMVGMIDPPRECVPEAIRNCTTAGITVTMITGDQPHTALAIARNIGLVGSDAGDARVMTGPDLDQVNEDELATRLSQVRIIAQANPLQKDKIVSALQKSGKVMAMTGDGVNDAPALKKADIGVAMGSGTDVAKEAADMILLDDSFTSIVEAVRFGRSVYENIKKFVLYTFSGISTELLVVLGSLFSPLPLAITAVQILWIDLGMEVLPALALSADRIDPLIMSQPPRRKQEHILNKTMILNIAQVALWQSIMLLLLFSWALRQYSLQKAQTFVFTTLIMFQMFNAFNCRTSTESVLSSHLWSNKYLISAIVFSISLQCCIVYFSFANRLFGTVPLTAKDWLIILLISSTVVPFVESTKLLRRRSASRAPGSPAHDNPID